MNTESVEHIFNRVTELIEHILKQLQIPFKLFSGYSFDKKTTPPQLNYNQIRTYAWTARIYPRTHIC